ncbi:alpha-hydroxy-acid oxidizing protein [Psychrilyobacter sp.]|uniref:alpha-hydroxy-acid oxidizing protein n=1 Tax=Psychrilyobacter sp. TaxID=2586924 RepID=UPI0030173474
MNLKEIKNNAREKMKGVCAICRECNGVWCRGMVPGMGGAGNGSTMQRNYNKLNEIRLMMRTLHGAKDPDVKFNFLGKVLSSPVMIAPITGLNYNAGGAIAEEDYIDDIVNGSVECGTIAMIGDGGNPDFYRWGIEAIKKMDGNGVAIIKPRGNPEIIKRIRMAEEAGALAVGVDVDGAGLLVMSTMGQPVGPKSMEELKELVDSTKLPFILKGILSVKEAEIAMEAGVAGIIVSNHGGRVLNGTISSIETLTEISAAIGDKMVVIADGGVREGIDIVKFLALGAHCVLVGRPIIWGSVGGRREGVKLTLETLKNQLYQSMILTGAGSLEEINKNMIYRD